LEFSLTPICQWRHMSRGLYLLVLRYCASSAAFADPCLEPSTRSPEAGSVSGTITTGLRQCYISWHPDVPAETTTVCAERRRSAGVFFAQARPRQSATSPVTLTEGSRTDKLAVLVYKCLNGMAPSYLPDEFLQPADLTTRTPLRSASSLFIRRTRLSTVGDRAFPVAAARGTVCRVMSPPLHRCLSTVAA